MIVRTSLARQDHHRSEHPWATDLVGALDRLCEATGICLMPRERAELFQDPPGHVDALVDRILRFQGYARTPPAEVRDRVRGSLVGSEQAVPRPAVPGHDLIHLLGRVLG